MEPISYRILEDYIHIDLGGSRLLDRALADSLVTAIQTTVAMGYPARGEPRARSGREGSTEPRAIPTHVLLTGRVSRRSLSPTDVIALGDQFLRMGIVNMKLAVCFPEFVPDEMSDAHIAMMANRGVRIALFESPAAAVEWLRGND